MRMKRTNAASHVARTFIHYNTFSCHSLVQRGFYRRRMQSLSDDEPDAETDPYGGCRSHFVRLVDYVCINPLHDENETHERMFLRADMGRCLVQHESLCGCFYQNLDQRV